MFTHSGLSIHVYGYTLDTWSIRHTLSNANKPVFGSGGMRPVEPSFNSNEQIQMEPRQLFSNCEGSLLLFACWVIFQGFVGLC